MSVVYRKEKGYCGLDFDILKSGLQKYIRRGIIDKALRCAVEMYAFRSMEGGKRLYTNMVHRLMIIYLEDVSAASPELWVLFDLLWKSLKEDCDKTKDYFVRWVELLCKARKSRALSHYNMAYSRYDSNGSLNVMPIIKHKRRKAKSISGLKEALEKKKDGAFYWVNKMLEDKKEQEIWDILEEKGKEDLIRIGRGWYKELKNLKEKKLVLLLIVYIIIKEPSLEITGTKDLSTERNWREEFDRIGENIEIDSYVVDMHTKLGRIRGKGREDFAKEGSLVMNEDMMATKDLYKRFYEMSKLKEDKVKILDRLETDCYSFEVRAQLTCSDSRPDTYFGLEYSSNRKVFVKGPYLGQEVPIAHSINQELKKKYFIELNSIESNVERLIPNRFGKVPLGCRNKAEKGKSCWFYITDCLIEWPILSISKSSKVWIEEKVVCWLLTKGARVADWDKDDIKDVFLNLLFRYIVGIPDPAIRNLLYVEGRGIISIDEEGYKHITDYKASLKEKRCLYILNWLRKGGYDSIKDVLEIWLKRLDKETNKSFDIPWIEQRLKSLLTLEGICSIFG